MINRISFTSNYNLKNDGRHYRPAAGKIARPSNARPDRPCLLLNLGARIGAGLALYLVVTALLLGLVLHTQLRQLSERQQDSLGEALAGQLAETLKQPLINRNPVSIQVILDNLISETALVARVSAYSAGNRLLAQSQVDQPPTGLAAYTRPISVDNTLVGMVRVELAGTRLFYRFQMLLWTTLGIWLVTTLIFAFWLVSTASGYSRRIRRATEGLGGPGTGHELDALEESLAPFTLERKAPQEGSGEFILVAVEIPDLPRLRAQLNAQRFNHLLRRVDDTIEQVLPIYRGERLPARQQVALLQFDADDEGEALYQALYCARALTELCRSLSAAERLPFEIRCALGHCHTPEGASPWRDDLQREECIARLLDILPAGGDWELLIVPRRAEDADLAGCELEPLHGEILRFQRFSPERQEAFDRQMEFLATGR